ncbi:hypothetical protein RvY_13930 [Ramazzottius varieornatus]|uniref:Uncharacterized protein n=1 Tax=Ramazzottius varieornatus TaxID=947166 RepID=A0A1D1VRC5_RAMVA|nr:hypothetical protein RvY_13930 [Ramazzottius varieornatus]
MPPSPVTTLAICSRAACRQLCSSLRPSLSRHVPSQRALATSTQKCYQELSPMQKRILVWTKKYPSVDKIPEEVPEAVMSKAVDKFRWKVAVILMVLTVLGSFGMIVSGKRAAARGESMTKRGLEWHEQLRPGSTSRD